VFEGLFTTGAPGRIVPEITGIAYITGEATLLLDERDPLAWGLRGAR
jgi:proline racemase